MFAITYQDDQNRIKEEELKAYLEENKNVLDTVKHNPDKYQDALGWMDPKEWASDVQLSRLEEKAKEVQSNADAFVLIGVGGSNNAARAVIKALDPKRSIEVYYAGNTISPYEVNRLLKRLEKKSVYINVIAKNFETLEPGIGFRVLRKWLTEQYKDQAFTRIIATGTRGSPIIFETFLNVKNQDASCISEPDGVDDGFEYLNGIGLLGNQ